jgi:formate hydrogenlyase subunit 3/multisubunit Na+/H+ antiporter MnhD subunit
MNSGFLFHLIAHSEGKAILFLSITATALKVECERVGMIYCDNSLTTQSEKQ